MMSTPPRLTDSANKHHYETWVYILLPLIGGGALVLALLVVVLVGLTLRSQVALVADLLLSVFILCPAAICLFPIYVLMMVIAFGMNKAHDGTARPLRRIQGLTRDMSEKVSEVTQSLNRKSIFVGSRFAFLDTLWDIFDGPPAHHEGKNDSTDTEQ